MTFEFPIGAAASLLVGVALLIAACSRPGSTTGSSALKPIDQAALQTMVDRTAKELLIMVDDHSGHDEHRPAIIMEHPY
jgi:hypothetical protein